MLYLAFLFALALLTASGCARCGVAPCVHSSSPGWSDFLFHYLQLHPELEQRVAQLSSALTATKAGDWRPLWKNVSDSLPMLIWKADPRWLYHISERAALEPLFAALLIIGILRALVSIKDRRNIFVLLWLGGGMAPALLTTVEYNTLHAIAALPAVFLLIGLGCDTLWQAVQTSNNQSRIARFTFHVSRFTFYVLRTGLALAFVLTGLEVTYAYFVTWGQNRDVRVSYHHHVVAWGATWMPAQNGRR